MEVVGARVKAPYTKLNGASRELSEGVTGVVGAYAPSHHCMRARGGLQTQCRLQRVDMEQPPEVPRLDMEQQLAVQTVDLTGRSYEEVDDHLCGLVGLSPSAFQAMGGRPFRGLVARDKEHALHEAMVFTMPCDAFLNGHPRFRNYNFFTSLFRTEKPLHGRRSRNTVVFDTSAYSASTHARNIELCSLLARVYAPRHAEVYSIRKDNHLGARGSDRPWARDHIALLVVRL